jgi:hypothetical protein
MTNLESDTIEAITRIANEIVDTKIRQQELRVGWVSGLIGVAFVFGIVHSIWLLKVASLPH